MDMFDENEPNIEEIEELIDSKNIEGLIDALKDTYGFYKKKLIIKELCRIGDNRVIEPFIKCLKYEGKQIREYIVDFLLKKVNGKAVKHLINAFNDLDEYYSYRRKDILKVLMQIGEAAVEPLIYSLYEEDHYIRKNAAEVLGNIRDERAIEPLINTLEDRYPSVRMMAAEALINLPDIRAVEPLIKTLKDGDYNVRWRSAVALGNIGDRRATEPLISALDDTEIKVRLESIKALGKIGDVKAKAPLLKIHEFKDRNNCIKLETVTALKKLNNKKKI